LFGFRVFDVLGFVQDNAGPRHTFEQVKVPVQQGVAGENEGLFPGFLLERGAFLALPAVVNQDGQFRCGTLGLLVPVADDGHGKNEQRGAPLVRMPVALDQGQGLDRLPQAHVVGQARTQAPAFEEREPGKAPHLVGPQRPPEDFRRRQLLERAPAFQLSKEIADPPRRGDAAKGDAA
jgi:hypothetical protein